MFDLEGIYLHKCMLNVFCAGKIIKHVTSAGKFLCFQTIFKENISVVQVTFILKIDHCMYVEASGALAQCNPAMEDT